MFNEEKSYKKFHELSLDKWGTYNIEDSVVQNITKLSLQMSKNICDEDKEEFESLLVLLNYLKDSFRINGQWSFLEDYEQFQIVEDILMNNSLKQFLDRVKGKVIISTIHAAKGLQWEYTISVFEDWCLKSYEKLDNLSLINVGLSRASVDAKILVQSIEQKNNLFIKNISE